MKKIIGRYSQWWQESETWVSVSSCVSSSDASFLSADLMAQKMHFCLAYVFCLPNTNSLACIYRVRCCLSLGICWPWAKRVQHCVRANDSILNNVSSFLSWEEFSDKPHYPDREAGCGGVGDRGDQARRGAPVGLSLVLSSSWFPLKYFMGINRK